MRSYLTWPGFARCLSVSFLLVFPVFCVVLHHQALDARSERTRQAVHAVHMDQLQRHLQSQALKNADDVIQQIRAPLHLEY